MACFPSPEAQVENPSIWAVTLEVTKLTLSKRVVEGLYEVPKPLLVSPKPFPTIDELMAKLTQAKFSGCKHPAATTALAMHFLVLTFLFTAY